MPLFSSIDGSYIVPPAGRYLASGYAADVYQLDDKSLVLKRPKSYPGDLSGNQHFRGLVDNERRIYELLGPHEGILKFFGCPDEETGGLKLEYADGGDLCAYITAQPKPSDAHRFEMIRRLSTTWLYIYSRHVLIQDINTDNVLVHHGMPKVGDFTQAIVYPGECPPPQHDFWIDIIGIGCILYSIEKWEVFDYDYFSDQRWPEPADLRSVEGMALGPVITKCWERGYTCMQDFHNDVMRLLKL
ncbi:hypothetical protein AYO20_08556 [Fonsecaea nubica]|uniref:Protein kinase domain-containing protein n=1 Tax=Fonsecaea nubica TaxID=856822 RepID=A0A178CNW8_9EURO|nr:hypothetical protein AYO20_08556 [Fonsecaea nubica]OAL30863.1 hypothetical protein AYO20_08556 [Fonsecaea nubica]